jgi:flagellar biosynthesis protein FliR
VKITAAEIAVFLPAFARAAAFLQAFPLTGDRVVPLKLRAALAAMIAMALVPMRPPLDPAALPIAVPAELLLGLAAGFAGRLVFAGVEAGGQLIGLQLGLGFAGTFDPLVAEQELPTQRLVRCLAGLAFLGAGGLEATLLALAAPPVGATTLLGILPQLIERGGEVLIAGVQLAAPALAVSLVANLAAGLAARAAPALNVFSVALALVLVVGAAVLLATGPAVVADVINSGRRASETVAHVFGLP